MKKLLASICAVAFVLVGCAGLTVKAPELTADYYITSCNDTEWKTEKMNLDVDLPIVVDHNVNDKDATDEYDVDIQWFWRDECNNAVAINYFEKVGGNNMCAIFYFDADTFNLTMTEDYMEANMVNMMGVDCKRMEATIAAQLEHGPYQF